MTYNDKETSVYSGKPQELYLFQCASFKLCLTSGDAIVTYAGNTYVPSEPIARTQIDQSQEQQAGNIDVTVMRDNSVAAFYIAYLPVGKMKLTIYRFHRGDSETLTDFVGSVISCKFNGSTAVLTCAPITQALLRKVPSNIYGPQCNHDLYSPLCGVNKVTYKVTGNVTVISGVTLTIPGLNSKPDGWFQAGYVQLPTGETRFITSHIGNNVNLMSDFLNLSVGEAVDVYPGCDRTDFVCLNKFNNLLNFLGFTRIPSKNPFTQSLT